MFQKGHEENQFNEKETSLIRIVMQISKFRDRTLNMQQGESEVFCEGHEIFQPYIDGP